MITHHLNPAQREFVQKWLKSNSSRPKFGAYDKASSQVAKIPVGRKPSAKSATNCRLGFHANEVVPLKKFDATRDLPAGWALANVYDSGGNHRIVNAGTSMLADLWNCWAGCPDGPLQREGGVFSERMDRELTANGIPKDPSH